MKTTYTEHGDTKTEDLDEYGNTIYKQEDCTWVDSYITKDYDYEIWLHNPSGKYLEVQCTTYRNFAEAEAQDE
jgi:hypothetical protein|tara:strand:+ start:524 stop:742 length:219 start_codon:yes stop_codon:yes gene_type:complete